MQFIREDKKEAITPNTPSVSYITSCGLFLDSAFLSPNIFSCMKNFFKQLLGEGDSQSSKRFSALLALVGYIVLTFISTYNSEGVIPTFLSDGLLMIIIGGLGLTSIEKIFKKK